MDPNLAGMTPWGRTHASAAGQEKNRSEEGGGSGGNAAAVSSPSALALPACRWSQHRYSSAAESILGSRTRFSEPGSVATERAGPVQNRGPGIAGPLPWRTHWAGKSRQRSLSLEQPTVGRRSSTYPAPSKSSSHLSVSGPAYVSGLAGRMNGSWIGPDGAAPRRRRKWGNPGNECSQQVAAQGRRDSNRSSAASEDQEKPGADHRQGARVSIRCRRSGVWKEWIRRIGLTEGELSGALGGKYAGAGNQKELVIVSLSRIAWHWRAHPRI